MDNQKTIFSVPVLVLVGPTAVGKTALSLSIAKKFDFEIISMDSMQVYRYMDVGTAKATSKERALIPHHLIDIIDPDKQYNAASFRKDALQAIAEIEKRGKRPLITGGTGLYLERLLHGIFLEIPADKKIREDLEKRADRHGSEKLHQELAVFDKPSASRIHPNDRQRLLRAHEVWQITNKPWSEHLQQQAALHKKERARFPCLLQIGLHRAKEQLYQRINMRSALMVKDGLESEVKKLLAMGFSAQLQSMQAIGYRHMVQYLGGEYDREMMLELLARDTRHYAKRQMTWFRKNKELQWFDAEKGKGALVMIERWLRGIR